MVLPLIQMETISRSTGKFPKASQGGLTSPKLSDSGLDFRIAVAKNTEGRQVRISCKNVTDRLSSVVFISHPNQLHICHTSRFVESQVAKFVTVAEMLHLGPNRTYRPRITPPESPPSDGKAHPSDGKAQTPRRKSGTLRWKMT